MEAIKQKIKALIPKAFMYRYYLHSAKKAVLPDLKRRVYDKVYDASEVERLNRDLTLQYHIVEKGLTMPEPRPGFGTHYYIWRSPGFCRSGFSYP